jgi:hypothetical protein
MGDSMRSYIVKLAASVDSNAQNRFGLSEAVGIGAGAYGGYKLNNHIFASNPNINSVGKYGLPIIGGLVGYSAAKYLDNKAEQNNLPIAQKLRAYRNQ